MTKAFFWKVVGRWEVSEETFKLLDTDYIWEGERANVKPVLKDTSNEQQPSCNRPPNLALAGYLTHKLRSYLTRGHCLI